jgi:hypothetical protein
MGTSYGAKLVARGMKMTASFRETSRELEGFISLWKDWKLERYANEAPSQLSGPLGSATYLSCNAVVPRNGRTVLAPEGIQH